MGCGVRGGQRSGGILRRAGRARADARRARGAIWLPARGRDGAVRRQHSGGRGRAGRGDARGRREAVRHRRRGRAYDAGAARPRARPVSRPRRARHAGGAAVCRGAEAPPRAGAGLPRGEVDQLRQQHHLFARGAAQERRALPLDRAGAGRDHAAANGRGAGAARAGGCGDLVCDLSRVRRAARRRDGLCAGTGGHVGRGALCLAADGRDSPPARRCGRLRPARKGFHRPCGRARSGTRGV